MMGATRTRSHTHTHTQDTHTHTITARDACPAVRGAIREHQCVGREESAGRDWGSRPPPGSTTFGVAQPAGDFASV